MLTVSARPASVHRTCRRDARGRFAPPPANTCRLTLEVRSASGLRTRYTVRPTPCPDGDDRCAYRLRKLDGTAVYDVVETGHGAECDCGDFIYRHDHPDFAGCKHIRALRALGLIGKGGAR